MLKITLAPESEPRTLKLEGRLSGPWVKELERSWSRVSERAPVAVDLSDVTFISSEGKKLLSSMLRQGADLRSNSLLTRFILDQVKDDAQGQYKDSPRNGNGGSR